MAHAASSLTPVPMITGLFRDRNGSERAYQLVVERGYEKSDIDVVMSDETSDETRDRGFARPVSSDLSAEADATAENTAAASRLGGPAGGTVGTIAPAVAAVGALLLFPGIVVAGPVAIALAAAGAVGVAGGVIGMLTDWGIPKGRIQEYEAGIRSGGILMGVKPHSREDAEYLELQWRANGGELVHS